MEVFVLVGMVSCSQMSFQHFQEMVSFYEMLFVEMVSNFAMLFQCFQVMRRWMHIATTKMVSCLKHSSSFSNVVQFVTLLCTDNAEKVCYQELQD